MDCCVNKADREVANICESQTQFNVAKLGFSHCCLCWCWTKWDWSGQLIGGWFMYCGTVYGIPIRLNWKKKWSILSDIVLLKCEKWSTIKSKDSLIRFIVTQRQFRCLLRGALPKFFLKSVPTQTFSGKNGFIVPHSAPDAHLYTFAFGKASHRNCYSTSTCFWTSFTRFVADMFSTSHEFCEPAVNTHIRWCFIEVNFTEYCNGLFYIKKVLVLLSPFGIDSIKTDNRI